MQDDLIELPSDYSKLDNNLKKNKSIIMDHIFDTILKYKNNNFEIKNTKIKLFKFQGTNLIVLITKQHLELVLKNLMEYYIDNESYEKCSIINKLINNNMK
jgi:hypothetical protein